MEGGQAPAQHPGLRQWAQHRPSTPDCWRAKQQHRMPHHGGGSRMTTAGLIMEAGHAQAPSHDHGGGPGTSTARPSMVAGPAPAQLARPWRRVKHQHSAPGHRGGAGKSTERRSTHGRSSTHASEAVPSIPPQRDQSNQDPPKTADHDQTHSTPGQAGHWAAKTTADQKDKAKHSAGNNTPTPKPNTPSTGAPQQNTPHLKQAVWKTTHNN